MTGGAFFPTTSGAEEYELDESGSERHAVQWVGTPGVKGPRWARMPLLTVGMLGIQCVWSIEMGYASPYLLDLGLSKSWMSLVFMAGPLSGLIVQPLIGIFADRSRSPLGRRRPFMLAGCAICVSAMILLGWTREISHFFGFGSGLAIGLTVWAIYLIDFSINAVMSTDRALVVDTLPPREQEEGSAWAGRMVGFGSVAGFFVGNLDLPPYLPFLGKTQLQILSFLTSVILMVAHIFTSWAVTERVLLRDDRPHSKSSLKSNIRAIWDNIFSLPPAIRRVCIIQFFASLGWFPILFFTTVWVSDIYKNSTSPTLDMDQAQINADSVRFGARALFFQALVNIVTSVGLPFLVADSGVQPTSEQHAYAAIDGDTAISSAAHKRYQEQVIDGGIVSRLNGWMSGLVGSVKDGSAWVLPIKGLTLVKVWWISQYIFAGTMAATWFVTTVHGAYFIMAMTGFCWALSQWAPYSILGELILIDGTTDRNAPPMILRSRMRTSTDQSSRASSETHHSPSPGPHRMISGSSSARHTPLHSRHQSRTSLSLDEDEKSLKRPADLSLERKISIGDRGGLSPLVIQNQSEMQNEYDPEFENSLVLRHSDESERTDTAVDPTSPYRHPTSPGSGTPISPGGGGGKETADKAGVILGIHNVFLVLPQFVVTFLSSVIFYLMEPGREMPGHHPNAPIVVGNSTLTGTGTETDLDLERLGMRLRGSGVRQEEGTGGSPDAVGLIFRIGGVSAAIGAFICMRLARDWARGRGV